MIKNSIVLVPFPFDDFSTIKVRPALCLTSEIGIHRHVIIAFISSKTHNNLENSEIIINENSETGLIKDSIIKLHKVVSVPRSLIKRKLGVLNKETQKVVNEKLKLLFEL
ncbi:MAG: type II toxin-antitoxin system PemK/MazF family toxin [Prolixibacteraceae bacterium]|nr:type II toxin-antitoxin system PemK/MazF family toxin [Prolixibacteraceae bacterium]MBN2649698.1 type II toxin-antitoxin system PemK/MazF family toxin [Prolixibacteraceae bacterium]